MATQFDGDEIDTPVSVYFGLEQGKVADLDIVAEAALAWSAALKTMIAAVEPGLTLKVQIVDGDKSSLWLNTLLTFAESKMEQIARGAERYPRLAALARGLAIIVVATPISVTAEDVWRALIHEQPEVVNLSSESQAGLMAAFDKVIADNLAKVQKERFAEAVSGDKSITGVGVAASSERRPSLVVTREQYAQYRDRDTTEVDVQEARRRTDIMDVTLVSPVLEDAERSWRFRQPGLPEFGAVMRDKGFLAAIGRRGVHEELRFGIPMKIEVEFKELFEGGIWMPQERSVLRVLEPKVDRGELPLGPPR